MNAQDKQELKSKIIDLIKKSEEDLVEIKKMTLPVKPENSLGRISRMDAINNKSVMEVAQRNKERKLSKLKMALKNIDEPDFGKCSNCGNGIQAKRLMFLPESTKCVRCAGR
jgi:DnaK suppressor protein